MRWHHDYWERKGIRHLPVCASGEHCPMRHHKWQFEARLRRLGHLADVNSERRLQKAAHMTKTSRSMTYAERASAPAAAAPKTSRAPPAKSPPAAPAVPGYKTPPRAASMTCGACGVMTITCCIVELMMC
eukprot:PhM_4_TR8406/c7_g2_i2/m.59045